MAKENATLLQHLTACCLRSVLKWTALGLTFCLVTVLRCLDRWVIVLVTVGTRLVSMCSLLSVVGVGLVILNSWRSCLC